LVFFVNGEDYSFALAEMIQVLQFGAAISRKDVAEFLFLERHPAIVTAPIINPVVKTVGIHAAIILGGVIH